MLWGGSGNRVVVGVFEGGVLDSLPRRGVVGWRFRRDADGGWLGLSRVEISKILRVGIAVSWIGDD